MKRPVQQGHRNIYCRVPTKDSSRHRLDNTLLHRGDKLPRNCTTDNFIYKFESRSRLSRLNPDHHMAILAATTRLFNIFVFVLEPLSNRFLERHLRFRNIHIERELATHSINQNFKMQLTHPRNNSLIRIRINTNAKGWILL